MYTVVIPRPVQKQLERLPMDVHQRIRGAIAGLASNPRPTGAIKLTGVPRWRIRIGDYRVIYEINDVDVLVTVVWAGNRRDAY